MFYLQRTVMMLLLLLLAACTRVQVAEQHSDFAKQPFSQRKLALERLANWKIKGSFSVQQQGERHIASYNWLQNDQSYQIEVYASLGLYRLRIEGNPDEARLYQAGEAVISADSASDLLEKRLGWSLPVMNLSYWIRGLPAPGSYRGDYDAYGHVIRIVQQGWQVGLSHYVTIKSLDLPRILDIRGEGLKIRVAIKEWDI